MSEWDGVMVVAMEVVAAAAIVVSSWSRKPL